MARWKKIYWDEFIPFAHGVRRLATYYNDAVRPDDPYEFVGLLRNQPLLAAQRNCLIGELAGQLASSDGLRLAVEALLERDAGAVQWRVIRDELVRTGSEGERFAKGYDDLTDRFLDVAFDHKRLHDQTESLLKNLLELSRLPGRLTNDETPQRTAAFLENRLLAAVGAERRGEAIDIIETGRVSWKLRDDDNLLVARLESQLLRALAEGADRLRASGRLGEDGRLTEAHAEALIAGLREPSLKTIRIGPQRESPRQAAEAGTTGESPRQLVGQPASPGVATATVRCIRSHEELGSFRHGEVLVCDAIQPTMTHLVPLASAIIERRGGMLIHGAIIARELGIPCVNGVRGAADVLKNGDLVTVDGHLGIVTIGEADFSLELRG